MSEVNFEQESIAIRPEQKVSPDDVGGITGWFMKIGINQTMSNILIGVFIVFIMGITIKSVVGYYLNNEPVNTELYKEYRLQPVTPSQ